MLHKAKHVLRKPKLKKELGIVEATFAGLGIILGAGIYALLGEAAGIAGNSLWVSFLIAALVAALTGVSYAELSSMYPTDASEGEYGEKAFGKRIGFLVAWLVVTEGIVSGAAVALGFGNYLYGLIGEYIPVVILAILCLVLFSFVNFWGIKESSDFNIIGTLIEGGGLVLIVILGIPYFGGVDYTAMAHGWGGTVSAAALIFFAFVGFEAIVKLSEETEHAKKVIPRALIYSIIISTVLYVLVAIASVSIVGWETLGQSKAPLATVAAAVLGSKAFVALAVVALFSTANTILMVLVTISRILYGLGKKFKKISFLSKVHETRKTPYVAIFFMMVVSILMSLVGDIKIVAQISNFSIFSTFIIVNASLLALRKKKPKKKRPFKTPLNIGWVNIPALLGVLVTGGLMVYLSKDWRVYAGGVAVIALALITYEWLTSSKKK